MLLNSCRHCQRPTHVLYARQVAALGRGTVAWGCGPPHVPRVFLRALRDRPSLARRIDTTGVIDKVKTLFHGFPELVLGFNTFLPKVRGGRVGCRPAGAPAAAAAGI